MIKVHVEVREEDALFSLPVLAENINCAVTIMKERRPSRDVRVVFPKDPQEFFDEGSKKTGAGPSYGPTTVPLRDEGITTSGPPPVPYAAWTGSTGTRRV
jgi:hypothetical protein